MRPTITAVLVLGLVGPTLSAAASPISDLRLGYSFMRISNVVEGGVRSEPVFMRHNLSLGVGIDQFSVGLVYQRATKTADTESGTPESGLMLTVGYDNLLGANFRLECLARVAVSSGVDSSQPLYAADTDLSLKLVWFDPAGWGPIARPIFPTAFFGSIVNRFGRVQVVAGGGLWWSGFSAFVSGLYAINGIDDPLNVSGMEDGTYAAIRNAAVTVSLAYDLDVSPDAQLHFEARRNFGFRNSGNDLVGVVQLRWFFPEDLGFEAE